MFDLEKQEKNIRDIIEGPPRMESSKKFESLENRAVQSPKENEYQSKHTTKIITREIAHKVGLELLSNQEFVKKLKELAKERLVRGEKITRLDTAIIDQEIDKIPYGLSREHLVENFDKNFLNFDIVRDGNDLAITFQKTNGDRALRSFDDEALAEMLNRLLQLNPHLNNILGDETENISQK